MYAGSPTIFNVPEITTLRRVKPLPKRRRTSAHGLSSPSSLALSSSTMTLSMGATAAIPGMASPLTSAAAAGGLITDAELEAATNALLAPPLPPPRAAHSPSVSQQSLQAQPPPLTSQVQSLSATLLPSLSSTRTAPLSPRPQAQSQQPSQPQPPQSTDANLDTNSDNRLLLSTDEEVAEELLAHADSLSSRMALQSYYMPMLGNVQEFLAAAAASAGISAGEMFKDRATTSTMTNNGAAAAGDGMGPYVDLDSADFLYGPGTGYHGMGFGGLGIGMGGSGHHEDDDSHGDGDYIDHLQQPGNTKKRKVPANVSVSQREDADSSDHTQDEGEERDVAFGRAVDYDDLELLSSSSPDRLGYPHYQQGSRHAPMVPTLYHGAKRGKLTAATLAGLQHKEMLKTRKRQLAAVLGALSHGDTLALDQALSMSHVNPDANTKTPKIRLSKRKAVRMARIAGMKENQNPNGSGKKRKQRFPVCEFTFACPSATADRLIATKEEVKVLTSKFEAELARQAEQLAATNNIIKAGSDETLVVRQPLAQVVPPPQQPTGAAAMMASRAKRSKGKKGRTSSAKSDGAAASESAVAEPTPQPPPVTNTSRGKKKKRSALANESNLRNYGPTASPLPVKFLSAEIPPRGRRVKKGGEEAPTTQVPLMDPADEWICAFCEYDLFYGDYGDGAMFRRAVRNRKKILKRRRRARERAAAAASGMKVESHNPPPPALVPANVGGEAPAVPRAPAYG